MKDFYQIGIRDTRKGIIEKKREIPQGGGGFVRDGKRKIKRGTERGIVYGRVDTIAKPYLMAASKILLPTLSCTLATVSLKKQKYDC